MTGLPPGWVWATLDEVALSVKNGIFVSRPGTQPNGVPILRISAVRPGKLHLDEVRYSGLDAASLDESGSLLEANDLLFTRYNGNVELVGACALVPKLTGALTYPDKLIRVRVDDRVALPKYGSYAFAASHVRARVRSAARTTAGQFGISGSSLRSIRFPVAPLAEQHRIVAVLDDYLSRLDAAVGMLRVVQARAERLWSIVLSNSGPRAQAGATQQVHECALGDIATSVRNGIFVARPGTRPAGVPILRISAVRPGQLRLDDVRYSGFDEATLAKSDVTG